MKRALYTLVVLIILTIVSALVANGLDGFTNKGIIILLLSIVKFVLVAFQFMELRKAHIFWKIALSIYLFLFVLIVAVLL